MARAKLRVSGYRKSCKNLGKGVGEEATPFNQNGSHQNASVTRGCQIAAQLNIYVLQVSGQDWCFGDAQS